MDMNEFKSHKIGIVYFYFGSWPWYFKFFLKSCAYNPDIDFIIISDIENPNVYPDNVMFIKYSLKQVEDLATEKLGFKTNMSSLYKICDFRPAVGFLFEHLLEKYDFWGFGDIDVIYGKIRDFITPKLLQHHDVISVRNDYPTGFFLLFKNSNTTNTLFKRSRDYKKIFSSSEYYAFDECNFQFDLLVKGGTIFDTSEGIECIMKIIKKAELKGIIKPFFDFFVIEGNPGKLKWDKGTLSFKNDFSVLLYHMVTLKNNTYFKPPDWKCVPDTYYVTQHTFLKNSNHSIKGALPYFFLEKIRVRTLKIKYLFVLKINQLYHSFKKRQKKKHTIWEDCYWSNNSPYCYTIFYDKSNYFLEHKRKETNHTKRSLIFPLLNSTHTFISNNNQMLIKLELNNKKKEMITKDYFGYVEKYATL